MEYAITENDDPNFIDKVLSTVSRSRKITLTYGDATIPGYMYRNEEAIILNVKKQGQEQLFMAREDALRDKILKLEDASGSGVNEYFDTSDPAQIIANVAATRPG